MAGVAVKNWGVSVMDLSWVVKDNNLGEEGLSIGGWVVLGVRGDVSSLDVLDRDVSNVEADVVTWLSSLDLFVMHLDRLGFSSEGKWSEGDDHAWLELAGLNTSDWDGSNTTNLVDILKWESEWLLEWSLRWVEVIEGLEEGLSLVPWHVVLAVLVFLVDHVITAPSRDWDELDLVDVVSDLLEVDLELTSDFLVTGLGVVDGAVVHLVAAHNHLLDTHGLGKESVLTSLTVLGESSFEATLVGGNHKDGSVSLGGSSDHVLDEMWPGASMMVKILLADSNFQRAISMVIPRSRSALSLSRTQAYLKELLPDSADSFSNFSMVLASIPPHL